MIADNIENGIKINKDQNTEFDSRKDLIITEEQLIILTDNFLEIQSRIASINSVLLQIVRNKNE